jgi:hypothetical protein
MIGFKQITEVVFTIIWRFKEATPFSINANPSIDEVAGVGSKEATEIFLNKKVYFYHMR